MTVLEYILWEFEGGKLGGPYTNRAADLGGPTRWGCTQAFLSAVLKRPVTIAEVKALTLPRAVTVMELEFLRHTGYAAIRDWRLRLIVVDFAVNFGADDATPALQRAIGAKEDGQFGPISQLMTNAADPLATCLKVQAIRQFKHVAQSYKPLQIENLRGWINRTTQLAARITEAEGLT